LRVPVRRVRVHDRGHSRRRVRRTVRLADSQPAWSTTTTELGGR
jgi:hypothetical protein